MTERRYRGRVYVQIDPGELVEGDVVEYQDRGFRVGRVEAVHHGRKRKWLRVAAITYHGAVVRPRRKLELREVQTAWRRRTEAGS